jgi:ribulose-phosphate 3-epimerase
MISLGIKTDPIETRYSYSWLFDIAREEGIPFIQLGSFFELYSLEDNYFRELRVLAGQKQVKIKSVFTAHRELGGFFYDNPYMEKVARKQFEKLIHVASVLGADFCGSNPGAVYRDQPATKQKGIERYLFHMKELMHLAREKGLQGLTMEPMSSMAEPPTTPEEIDFMMGELHSYHQQNAGNTVPFFLCGDISHGLADPDYRVKHTHTELFMHGIPWMAEFHLKNTDSNFNSTFGFSGEECKKGIVDLEEIKGIIVENREKFPVRDLVAYLEISGPKVGRDYSDPLLERSLRESLRAIKQVFGPMVV